MDHRSSILDNVLFLVPASAPVLAFDRALTRAIEGDELIGTNESSGAGDLAPTFRAFLALGVLICCVPLAKLQAAPAAATLGVFALILGVARAKTTGWRPVIALLA